MARSTYRVFLMKGTDGETPAYTKLLDIKDFPDLGGAPEMLETTTLSDNMQTYVPGIQSLDAMEFTANYTLEDYQAVVALAGIDTAFAVWFSDTSAAVGAPPDGSDGKWEFRGQISAFPVGGGVNEVVDMTITIAPSTPINLNAGA